MVGLGVGQVIIVVDIDRGFSRWWLPRAMAMAVVLNSTTAAFITIRI